jgi:hypothetical protein
MICQAEASPHYFTSAPFAAPGTETLNASHTPETLVRWCFRESQYVKFYCWLIVTACNATACNMESGYVSN